MHHVFFVKEVPRARIGQDLRLQALGLGRAGDANHFKRLHLLQRLEQLQARLPLEPKMATEVAEKRLSGGRFQGMD